ncbi:class I tRNA ligase family protein [Mycoplasmopsis cynos]|nr:class I tRNA ligase family protein [Mycoplasmopsis cynos]
MKNADGSYLDINSKEAYQRFEKWLPVDLYIGGQEHAVGHLIYSRFWHKFLYDIKILPVDEPFLKVVNQGMILGPDGQKMSKSRGNVINPDEIIDEYGADTLRVYEMFMGPLAETKEWSVESIRGIRKWLDRVEVIISKFSNDSTLINENHKDSKFISLWQSTIKEVTIAINTLKFNIAISKLMVFINSLYKVEKLHSIKPLVDFCIMFSTLAPHLSEELLEQLNQKQIKDQKWPNVDEKLIQNSIVKIVVQVNGKVRCIFEKEGNLSEEEIFTMALSQPNVQKFIDGRKLNVSNILKIK